MIEQGIRNIMIRINPRTSFISRIIFGLSVYLALAGLLCLAAGCTSTSTTGKENLTYELSPSDRAVNVNPDTRLKLTFHSEPILGDSGKICVYDASDNRLVDSLDMSIPPGPMVPNRVRVPYTPTPYEYVSGNFTNANTRPGTPSGAALPTPDSFQLTIIGGFTDGFHFYPVIIHDSVATIYLHNNPAHY